MIGYIQKVLVDTIRAEGGEQALAIICQRAGVEGIPEFRIDQDYPDDECLRMIAETGAYFGLDEESLFRLYADRFIRESRERFPMFYQMAGSARDFLERQPRVHTVLAAGLRGEASRDRVRDKFDIERNGDDLMVTYRSPNRLCGLYEALFNRVLEEFGETGSMEILACQKRGAEACRFCLKPGSGDE
ncbi:heme NO-binding domain-containing protein [Marinobacter sp. M1N3S26]|uniref:heme NO-binding domain-containing protein n=1 Tax=unclassified Marinobacter TaxID=83889 RepID=UPI00387A8974